MPYYLRHYFDPDFNHQKLAPQHSADGSVDHYYLGYVQNVVAGQMLAELIDLDQHPDLADYDPRFIYKELVYPCGPNCSPHPGNPNRIIATANGYCFYLDGLITVKKLLNIRRDVDFHTGNVMFVGDIAAHGVVRPGFTVQGNNVLIKQTVEGAVIKAQRDIVCEAGVNGAQGGLLEAGGNIHLPFCENATLRARGNILIEGSCMHSTIHVGGSLVVKGRLQGGTVYANNLIYVEKQLGGENTITKILMGYDPFEFLTLQGLEDEIKKLRDTLREFERISTISQRHAKEYERRIEMATLKLKVAHKRRGALWKKFHEDELGTLNCRIVVPGKLNPEVEVAIARAWLRVSDYYHNVKLRLVDDDIELSSPAA